MTRHYEGYARSLLEFQVVVFAAFLVVGTALVISRWDSLDPVLFASGGGVIALVTVATLLWRHRTQFQRFSLVLPLLDIVGVRLAMLADNTLHSGGGLLLILPIIWIAYTFGPWGFAVCLALLAATSPQSFFTGYSDVDSFDFTRLVAYPLILIVLAGAAGVSGVRIRRKRTELAAQTRLTERAVQARDDLIEAVTHELRTPLTSILGNAELLGRGDGNPEKVERRASVIVRNAEQMETLLADLLMARSTESTPLALRRESVDVRAIINTSLAASRAAADAGDVTLHVTHLAPVWMSVDPHRIRQVFDNLFTNAVKYNRGGGTVTVTETRDAAAVTFAVTDTGGGIAAAERARVFDPYFRTEQARRSTQVGTGLGLGISRDIARRHGGDLRLVASSSTGSRFELTLPLMPS